MWTASSLPPLSCQQCQPLQPPLSVLHAFSCLQPSSRSGLANRQWLGRNKWSTTRIRAPIQCSCEMPKTFPAFFPRTRRNHLFQVEQDDPDSRDSHGNCYSTSSGRRMLLFMSSISLLLPQRSLAETLDAAKLFSIQNSLRTVLSKAKAAGMLRMAFHDGGTYDKEDRSGGMNGSILYELDRPENAGLNKSLKILEKAKEEISKFHQVSWADLIAVAGSEAVFLCGGPSIPVKVGRVDVSTQELVALSGAHTLGSKGFGNPNVFDNAYYKILLEKPWKSSGSMSSMIGLPSDRALVEDEECLRWIEVYAGDQERFFVDFTNAYIKLVNSGAVWRNEGT